MPGVIGRHQKRHNSEKELQSRQQSSLDVRVALTEHGHRRQKDRTHRRKEAKKDNTESRPGGLSSLRQAGVPTDVRALSLFHCGADSAVPTTRPMTPQRTLKERELLVGPVSVNSAAAAWWGDRCMA
jgi:hypothetical protein